MDHFCYRHQQLHVEDVPLSQIAEEYDTPCYVYSRATLEQHWRAFADPLVGYRHLLCYAVKANSNLAILNLLARQGAGFDIVSGGELERVLAAGGDPQKIVFSGVGKRTDELERALSVGIHTFNVESLPELERLNGVAGELGMQAPVSLRVNPDVDPGTHPYIATGLKESKFGIPMDQAETLYLQAAQLPHIQLQGVDCHIGSQLTTLAPFVDALTRVLQLVDRLAAQGILLSHLDMGGGLGIPYRTEQPPSPREYLDALLPYLADRSLTLILEPGRAIVGNAGVLLTRVEYLKHTPHKNFALVDAGMNDLLRPALYGAWQEIVPVIPRSSADPQDYDIVGPVCESGDFLGRSRSLALSPGDLLAVRSAGAYGFAMSSNYNTRPRPAEVLVDGSQIYLIRSRETLAELWAHEGLLP